MFPALPFVKGSIASNRRLRQATGRSGIGGVCFRSSMASPLRLTLFIDAQNTYLNAKEMFFPEGSSSSDGQFDPWKLGELIASRRGPDGEPCALHGVRLYTGRPDPRRASKTHAAHMKQCAVWEASGTKVITRPLRYPPGWPRERAQEKGVDIALAIDFVTMAIEPDYDVGVIMSTDTDLLPALEFVGGRTQVRQVAVAAWRAQGRHRRLRLPRSSLWCYWLDRADYRAVSDPTNYAR